MKKINYVKIYWIAILIVFQSIGIYNVWDDNTPHDVECGIIIDMYNNDKEHYHKSNLSVDTKEYLVIQMNSSKIVKKEVSSDTYYNHKSGDRICFDKPIPHTIKNVTLDIISVLVIGLDLIAMFLLILFIFIIIIPDMLKGIFLKQTFENISNWK